MPDAPIGPVHARESIPEPTTPLAFGSALRLVRGIIFLLVGMVVCVSLLSFPDAIAGPSLDQSWGQALGFFMWHRLQAGRDYIFTFGPLGYFFPAIYDTELFWYKCAWELVMKSLFAVLLLRLTGSTLGVVTRLILCLLVVKFLPGKPDDFYSFFLFLIGVRLATVVTLSRWHLLGYAFLLATIGLIKFTFFVEALIVVALSSALLLRSEPRKQAFLPLTFFCGSFLTWWLILGQRLSNIPAFLRSSLDVAAGYTEAMAGPGEYVFTPFALVLLGMLGLTLLHRSFLKFWGTANVLTTAFVSIFLFLQWKHGFVRQDEPNPGCHMASLFTMTLFCPFFFPALFPTYSWGRGARLVLISYTMLLSTIGIGWVTREPGDPKAILSSMSSWFSSRVTMLLHPRHLKHELEREREAMRQRFALAQIAAEVKDRTIDTFTYEQGVLLLNQLNWHPRPVFQGYCAFTPFLQTANASFLAGAEAPEYVLFKLQPIDGRLPSQEDGRALIELLKRYQPVLMENYSLLLRRKSGGGDPHGSSGKTVREAVVRFDQEVEIGDLSAACQVAKVRLKYSRAGELRKALYKPPLVFIRLRTVDHQVFTYRFIPATGETGFLLNPLLQDMEDIVNFYTRQTEKRVVALSITTDEEGKKSYQDAIDVAIESEPDLVPASPDPKTTNRLRYSMMKTAPDKVVSSVAVHPIFYGDRLVLAVHPDGAIHYAVSADTHRVRGQFGILPDAYEKGRSDGARFTVEFHAEGAKPVIVWERCLDPLNRSQDRGSMDLDLTLPAHGAGELVFRLSAIPGRTANWAWSFWTGIALE